MILKDCVNCKESKPTSAYSPQERGKYGVRSICRACGAIRQAERRQRNGGARTPEQKEARWAQEIMARYGLNAEGYRALLAQQGGVCAICAGPPNGPGSRLHVDHCHATDRVRGLLCGKCNTAVGLLDDDSARARRVAEYLN